MRMLIVFTTFALAAAPATYAQEDFSRIKARLGQQMIVTEDGLAVAGTLTDLSPSVLKIGDREFRPGPDLKIERDNGNTVGRSATVGMAVGAVFGLVGGRGNGRLPAALACTIPGALWGAMAGLAVDRHTTVYDTTASSAPPLGQIAVPAQSSGEMLKGFGRLRVKPGDRVFINDGGVMTSGVVTDVTPTRLRLGTREFAPHAGLTIEKKGDPIWDGAAIGFALGSLLAPTFGGEACLNIPVWSCSIEAGIETAALGALIDWAHKGRTTIYDTSPKPLASVARHVLPIMTTHEHGVAMSFNLK